jgi:hypothetical protein
MGVTLTTPSVAALAGWAATNAPAAASAVATTTAASLLALRRGRAVCRITAISFDRATGLVPECRLCDDTSIYL